MRDSDVFNNLASTSLDQMSSDQMAAVFDRYDEERRRKKRREEEKARNEYVECERSEESASVQTESDYGFYSPNEWAVMGWIYIFNIIDLLFPIGIFEDIPWHIGKVVVPVIIIVFPIYRAITHTEPGDTWQKIWAVAQPRILQWIETHRRK